MATPCRLFTVPAYLHCAVLLERRVLRCRLGDSALCQRPRFFGLRTLTVLQQKNQNPCFIATADCFDYEEARSHICEVVAHPTGVPLEDIHLRQ